MNYLTKEELEEITNKLLENPTRETLKELNTKYNGVEEVIAPVVENQTNEEVIPEFNNINIPNINTVIEQPVVNQEPVNLNNIPNTEINNMSVPSFEVPSSTETSQNTISLDNLEQTNAPEISNNINLNNVPNNEINNMNVPSFEVPKLNVPESNNNVNNPNNQVVDFNGNLWEPQNTTVNNMMDTTDNFNIGIMGTPENNNVPINNGEFFTPNPEPINNPIPVGGDNFQGPSMFGQFEQNFNNMNS